MLFRSARTVVIRANAERLRQRQLAQRQAPTPPAQAAAPGFVLPTEPTAAGRAFRCDGRRYCSEMSSCAEAKYFLKHCPNVSMDGNHDGIPCEQQWCGPR